MVISLATATVQYQKEFIDTAVGKYFDPDGMYKYQCKDLIDAMCIWLWGDWINTISPGNANQVRHTYNPEYFDWIPNVVGDPNSFPQFGDVGIGEGDASNPAGHIWIVLRADFYSMLVLQQNVGGMADRPAEIGILGYDQPGVGPVLGWLRPKLSGASFQPSQPALPSEQTLNVIDVSTHQRGLNLAATGAQAVVIKATEGAGGWTDDMLDTHTRNARAAGLPVGWYHYARIGQMDGNTPEAEAQSFIDAVAKYYQPGDKLYLDWEAAEIDLSRGDLAKRWLDIVSERFGTKAVFYSYLNVLTSHAAGLDVVRQNYRLWAAVYPSSQAQSWGPINAMPALAGWDVEMWQYSSTGRLPGYGGDLDLNVFYGGLDEWKAGTVAVPGVLAPAPVAGQCVVEPGDTLSGIATQFGVSLESLIAANPGIDPDWIYPGQVLNLPGGTANAKPVVVGGQVTQCIVDPGDSLSSIAAQFGVDLNELVRVNGIQNANLIYPGQVLQLPVAVPESPAAISTGVSEVIVDPGDTLAGIALQFGVPLSQVVNANPGIDPNLIFPGQVLQLQ
ncbi:endolysin [Arthrobacter phage DanielleIgnace]|nr:endolysin [Arthrobacter phage DanielleIgnace]